MRKKNKRNNKKFINNRKEKSHRFVLPKEIKKQVYGSIFFLVVVILIFSFFNLAGIAGRILTKELIFLVGGAIFALPWIFIITSLVFFFTKYKKFSFPTTLAVLLFIFGISGILGSLNSPQDHPLSPDKGGQGGWLGYIFSLIFLKLFGFWLTQIIFGIAIFVGCLIFWQLVKQPSISSKEVAQEKEPAKPSIIKRIFAPKFKVKEVEPVVQQKQEKIEPRPISQELKSRSLKVSPVNGVNYEAPPFDLLDPDKGEPSSGDIKANSAIIKKTLQNFDISVEMSEVKIGPTVTQYTLKPAEGVKLSKITSLANDLSLALAAHPIRIEAPIPGKALVGIEIPNKIRKTVRLRNLISLPEFQRYDRNLAVILGRDVAGSPVFADIGRMPHLLVAGATGTGKTICLNSLILSLIYRNSPEILRFILVDPKRVEFPVYQDLPHLLTPVVYDAQKTVFILKWLTGEMERRFQVLAEARTRDIALYNEMAAKKGEHLMPYVVLIIDELADLMAARGKEIEAGIVRLAQMARAVGIHLIVATQRPSVEVITGLIKANITSRIAFQVASQVDSRTILDTAGAEKLLGLGDLLYLSAETAKPKRIQGVYVSEKEVKRVMEFFKKKGMSFIFKNELEENLRMELERLSEESEAGGSFKGVNSLGGSSYEEDPLYEEAKKLVIRSKKASASLLQRHLRIGYARAARLIDMLEEKGVVGPGEGAKPREVYIKDEADESQEDSEWYKV